MSNLDNAVFGIRYASEQIMESSVAAYATRRYDKHVSDNHINDLLVRADKITDLAKTIRAELEAEQPAETEEAA